MQLRSPPRDWTGHDPAVPPLWSGPLPKESKTVHKPTGYVSFVEYVRW